MWNLPRGFINPFRQAALKHRTTLFPATSLPRNIEPFWTCTNSSFSSDGVKPLMASFALQSRTTISGHLIKLRRTVTARAVVSPPRFTPSSSSAQASGVVCTSPSRSHRGASSSLAATRDAGSRATSFPHGHISFSSESQVQAVSVVVGLQIGEEKAHGLSNGELWSYCTAGPSVVE